MRCIAKVYNLGFELLLTLKGFIMLKRAIVICMLALVAACEGGETVGDNVYPYKVVKRVMCKLPDGELRVYETKSTYPLSRGSWSFVTVDGMQVHGTNCHAEFKL